ncbi:ParB/Srx family N-terminal domain-containing protein [Pseudaestuariivita sp.]|uniref:ParB/Srx family N-terminal domain-containing protein n=1 Tax=Pseudaestuariivita sp. TaxID=2211669 RepID=UPI004059F2AA
MPHSNTLAPLDLIHLPPSRVVPDPNTAREYSPGKMRRMRASIREFGLLQPILIDEDDVMIAGNARLAAALDLGMPEVPCVRILHLSPPEGRAYAIADNKIAELGTWNEAKLGEELRFLAEQELSFDLEVLGFETAELDFIILGD